MNRPLRLPDGRLLVPENRWDLVGDERRVDLPVVSVIVPYYQNRLQLDATLTGLALQDYPPDRYEVVVADDGSDPPLRLDSPARHRIRVVRQEDAGFRAAAARNLAVENARGDLFCFLDQDCVPEPGYLRRLTRLPGLVPDAVTVAHRRHATLSAWTPHQVSAWLRGRAPGPSHLSPPRWLQDAYRETGDLLRADATSYRYVISAVMCCGRELFEDIGGFDETFRDYGGEDWDFAYRAFNAGAVFAHVPTAVAWHDGPDWAGRGEPAARLREKERESERLGALIPARAFPDADSTNAPFDVLISWLHPAALDHRALDAAVADLLSLPFDCAVYLGPDRALRFRNRRVLFERPTAQQCARARYRVAVAGRQMDLAAIRRALEAVEGAYGRARIRTSHGIVTAESTRALRRAARWHDHLPDTDLVAHLFGALGE